MTMDGKDDLGQEIAREISHTIARRIAIGIALFIAFLLFIVFGGIAVQLLWNWLVPDILNLRRITFWEALGLLALCRILFGGFGRGGSHGHSDGRGRRKRREWWKPSKPAGEETAGPPSSASAQS
jgi:hypothetical protein